MSSTDNNAIAQGSPHAMQASVQASPGTDLEGFGPGDPLDGYEPPRGPKARPLKSLLSVVLAHAPKRLHPAITKAFTLTLPGILLGLVFGACVLARCCIEFCGEVDWRSVDYNYLTAPTPLGVAVSIISTLLAMSFLSNMPRIVRWIHRKAMAAQHVGSVGRIFVKCKRPRGAGIPLFLGVWALLLLLWLPVLLSYYPGSVPNDAAWSIGMAMGTLPLNSHHPLFFTFIVWVCFNVALSLGGDYNTGVLVFSILQSVVLAGSISYLISWMARRRLPKVVVLASLAYFVFTPLFSGYSIIMWKDPMFGAFALLYTLLLFDAVRTKGRNLRRLPGIFALVVLSALLILIRSNGFLLVFGSLFFLMVFMFKRVIAAFLICAVTSCAVFFAIQVVIPERLSVETEYVESVGIQLQQVAYVVVTEGSVPMEYQELIDNILPGNLWHDAYSPCCVDSLKWNENFDKDYLSDHRQEFIAMWIDLGKTHLFDYIKAYVLNTFGFWTPGSSNYKEMLTLTMSDDSDAMPFSLHSDDLVQEATGVSLRPIYEFFVGGSGERSYFSGGTLAWIGVFSSLALISICRKRWLIALAPVIFNWLSVMIASPAAFGLRYIFVSVICLPIILILPIYAVGQPPDEGLLGRKRAKVAPADSRADASNGA